MNVHWNNIVIVGENTTTTFQPILPYSSLSWHPFQCTKRFNNVPDVKNEFSCAQYIVLERRFLIEWASLLPRNIFYQIS